MSVQQPEGLPRRSHTEALRAIWELEQGHVRARVASIQRAIDALERQRLDESTRAEGQRAAHMLAGSVGTFGLPRASHVAAELERELSAPAPECASSLQQLATALRREIELGSGRGVG